MSDLWLNSDGIIVHPNAPAGGGGPGGFRSPGQHGIEIGSTLVPHPHSPAGRTHYLDENQKKLLVMYTRKKRPLVLPPQTIVGHPELLDRRPTDKEIQFADVMAQAQEAEDRGDTRTAREMYQVADGLLGGMMRESQIEIGEYIAVVLGAEAGEALLGVAAEGIVAALGLAVEEGDALLIVIVKKISSANVEGILDLLKDVALRRIKGEKTPNPASPEARKQGIDFLKSIGLEVALGIAEKYQMKKLMNVVKFVLERIKKRMDSQALKEDLGLNEPDKPRG